MDLVHAENIASVSLFDIRLSQRELHFLAFAIEYMLQHLDNEQLNKQFVADGMPEDETEAREFLEIVWESSIKSLLRHGDSSLLTDRYRNRYLGPLNHFGGTKMDVYAVEQVDSVRMFIVSVSESELEYFAIAAEYLLRQVDDEQLQQTFVAAGRSDPVSEVRALLKQMWQEMVELLQQHCEPEFLPARFKSIQWEA